MSLGLDYTGNSSAHSSKLSLQYTKYLIQSSAFGEHFPSHVIATLRLAINSATRINLPIVPFTPGTQQSKHTRGVHYITSPVICVKFCTTIFQKLATFPHSHAKGKKSAPG